MNKQAEDTLMRCLNDRIFRRLLIALEKNTPLSELAFIEDLDLPHMSRKRVVWEERLGFAVAIPHGKRLRLTAQGLLLAKAAAQIEQVITGCQEQLLFGLPKVAE